MKPPKERSVNSLKQELKCKEDELHGYLAQIASLRGQLKQLESVRQEAITWHRVAMAFVKTIEETEVTDNVVPHR